MADMEKTEMDSELSEENDDSLERNVTLKILLDSTQLKLNYNLCVISKRYCLDDIQKITLFMVTLQWLLVL